MAVTIRTRLLALPLLSAALVACEVENVEPEVAVSEEPIVQENALSFAGKRSADVVGCTARHEPDCDDVDQDGLVDAWEDELLAHFEPRLEFDEQEKGLRDDKFRMGMAGRVVPRSDDPSRVVVFFAFAFSEDYGKCTFTEHHGDVERAVLEIARVAGTLGDAKIVKAYTASHEGDSTDASRKFDSEKELRSLEFLTENGAPRWLLYTARNKHGTYPSKGACEAKWTPCLRDFCGADGVKSKNELRRLLPILNAGEPDHPRDSDWTELGYPGLDVWMAEKFCGTASRGDCDSAPRFSLVRDPFTKKDL